MPSAVTYSLIKQGKAASVRLSPRAKVAYEEVQKGTDERSRKRRKQLDRYFQEFCDNEPHRLNDLQYKKEGSFPAKGRSIAVWAFKPFQWRLYGSVLTVNGHKCFVGVEVDEEKKQDRANKALLEAAAAFVAALDEC